MERRQLTDDDWAPLRDAAPAFGPIWARTIAERFYDPSIPSLRNFADFVVGELLVCHEDVTNLAAALENLYADAAASDDVALRELLTVSFLEGMISEADDLGVPLTWVQPLLVGPRTCECWSEAVAYKRPDHVWRKGVGAVPHGPFPRPVGTVRVLRGSLDREAGVYRMVVQLIGGDLRPGYFLRRIIGKGFRHARRIADIRPASIARREFELALAVEHEVFDAFESFFTYELEDNPYWQIAAPHPDVGVGEAPNDSARLA